MARCRTVVIGWRTRIRHFSGPGWRVSRIDFEHGDGEFLIHQCGDIWECMIEGVNRTATHPVDLMVAVEASLVRRRNGDADTRRNPPSPH